ncbi:MAG: alpha/beta hydrolase, partial [Chitinophagaceae bacterium]
RFGNMAGRRIYSQFFVRYSASVPADEYSRTVVLILIFCNFIQQRFHADDFQIPPHRQAVSVGCNCFPINNDKMRKLTLQLVLIFLSITSIAQLPVKTVGRIVEVNNAKIYFEEYGQGEPLFLLHGFLNTAENWKGFIEQYSKNYRVIVWDMRGHGRSTNPDDQKDFRHEQAAMDLLELMNVLQIDKTKAIGHSSGGITLLYASSIAPKNSMP